jgi:hypothetical protein
MYHYLLEGISDFTSRQFKKKKKKRITHSIDDGIPSEK